MTGTELSSQLDGEDRAEERGRRGETVAHWRWCSGGGESEYMLKPAGRAFAVFSSWESQRTPWF